MVVRLPEGVPERIETLVGKGRIAQFVREAVLRELERCERLARRAARKAEASGEE